MQSIENICGLFFLAVCSVVDTRCRRIPLWLLGAAGFMVVLVRMMEREVWILYAGGAVVGCFFIAVSWITREGLGYGDSLLMVILGGFLGVWRVISLLMIAFLSGAVFAIILFTFKKKNSKQSFPFIPFLMAGYIGVMWL